MTSGTVSNPQAGNNKSPVSEADDHDNLPEYQFITFQDPHTLRSRGTQRLIRSHGVRKSLQTRRKKLLQANENFRAVEFTQTQPSPAGKLLSPRTSSIAINELDPFESLAVNSLRLQTLINHNSAPQALEPVCNITDSSSHQNFHIIFQSGFSDPALSNAVMLSLSVAASGYQVTQECLSYKSRAISYINQKIQYTQNYSISATIGAILLLIGVEGRLGAQSQVQIHLDGIMHLLRLCDSERIHLHDGIKRATFWQDLFVAWLTGSRRALSHDIFPELYWNRDPFLSSLYTLPAGFLPLRYIFGAELAEVIEDLHALQVFRETSDIDCSDPISVMRLDNHQAWIESRLYWCFQAADAENGMVTSSILTLYLCAYMMFTSVWASTFIPSHISNKLLRILQRADNDTSWISHQDVLLWCLMVGGTFSRPSAIQSEYVTLLRRLAPARLDSWPEMEEFLEAFIWSPKLFCSMAKTFWDAL